MSSRFPNLFAAFLGVLACLPSASATPLRICADPDNLPFSNYAGAGFDDRIIALVAHDIHRSAVFVWARPRRGFVREQFSKNACDILLGVPIGMRGIDVTEPYYTSSYAFVTLAREHLQLVSFNDEHLNGRRIGLQILEEDLAPPSLPLIRSGHAAQIVGFESFGNQEGDVVKAVANGRVGVAVVWGPVAGYFSHNSRVPLTVTSVPSTYSFAGVPFTYSIGFGVHKQDVMLLQQLNTSIHKLQPQIDHLLGQYAVPTVAQMKEAR